jgi:hypothetical protein
MWQSGCGLMQRFETQVYSRRNHPPDIGTVVGHDIECGGRPEIYYNQIATVPIKRTRGIHKPVRADLGSGIDPRCRRQCTILTANNQWTRVVKPVGKDPEVKDDTWHSGRDDHVHNVHA